MIISIGEQEYVLNEPISQIRFDIVKSETVVAGLQEVTNKKIEALGWLVPLRRLM
jgi:hypothetical protein